MCVATVLIDGISKNCFVIATAIFTVQGFNMIHITPPAIVCGHFEYPGIFLVIVNRKK